jgi:histidinol-phosphate aminotransferase
MNDATWSGIKPWLLDEKLTRPDWVKSEPRSNDKLWLDKNENSDPQLLDLTTKILHSIDPRSLFSYPDSARLYQKLAVLDGLSPRQLRLTPGSDGGIRVVFEALLQPGERVLHTTPTFAMYPVYCQIFGVEAKTLAYRRSASGPLLEAQDIIDAISEVKPRLVCLPNPDSPTGTFLKNSELKEIITAAQKVSAFVLIDEAYYPFHPETAATLLSEFDNLIVARTFAKAWGLAGLRIGYTIASEKLTHLFHKIRPMYEVSTLAVAFIEEMINHYDEVLKSVERICAGRDYFARSMRELGLDVIPSAGNFCHVAFGEYAAEIHAKLLPKVFYRQDSNEACLKGYSRFSATTPEIFKPLVQTIQEVVLNRKKQSLGEFRASL